MEHPVKRWSEAIESRKSTRTFSPAPLPRAVAKQLVTTVKGLQEICPAARAVITPEAPSDIFRGVLGSYGAVQGAPACAVLVANTTHPHYQAMLGYLGESLILEATALGLATCWVGGFFHKGVAAQIAQLEPHERILAVTPLGYPEEIRWGEKLMKRFAKSAKRKSLMEICTPAPEHWPEWAIAGLAAARLAPSAVNRQPWHFTWENGTVQLDAGKGVEVGSVSRRLDCGIAMLHFSIGAAQAGKNGTWEWAASPLVGVFRPA